MGGTHGTETAQDPRGLPDLPRRHPPATLHRFAIGNERATCSESCPRGSAGGPRGKGPDDGFLAARPTQWAAARCFHTATDFATEDWGGAKAARILAGDAPGAARDIRAEADRRHLTDDQRTAADKACRYLENNGDFVHYDQALTAGWPIASGAVEGAARHLVADRLDITGSRWTVPGAEAVLTLRTVISNGDFPDYWTFHTRKEHERLHPLPDQHIHALQA
ncbi:hypothetical protein [Streptomyces sp. I6]|uniref:hypothetical protein n=1 Tax=Streptomyces sp. I6 TaxID=2483113 RepID=UPI000F44CC9C|nr:hypothetical protein [Streptomyces sp. I6]RNL73190.1 hypothetical protein EBF04_24010 [Streptomyces sp. I6]